MARRIIISTVLLKPVVFAISLLPLLYVALLVVDNRLGPDPAKTLALVTGEWSIRFLLLTLFISSLSRMDARLKNLLQYRRMIGLFTFFYASLHLLVFIALILGFDGAVLLSEIKKRPYITAGFVGWLLLAPLAITSNNWSVRKLGGQRWKALHRASYLALGLGVIHVFWQVRSDWGPALAYSVLAAGLLAERAHLYSQFWRGR